MFLLPSSSMGEIMDEERLKKVEGDRTKLLAEIKQLLSVIDAFFGPPMSGAGMGPAELLIAVRKAMGSAWKTVNEVSGP